MKNMLILNKISFKFAINTMLTMLCLVIVFHLFVLSQIIPFNIVWGGKFENVTQMRSFEITSVLINLFMIFIIAIKGQYIKFDLPIRLINIILWLFVLLFTLNTIGNLFAKTSTEALVFTPLTLVSSVLCVRIVMGV